jgi:hypothetical protein
MPKKKSSCPLWFLLAFICQSWSHGTHPTSAYGSSVAHGGAQVLKPHTATHQLRGTDSTELGIESRVDFPVRIFPPSPALKPKAIFTLVQFHISSLFPLFHVSKKIMK